MKKLLYLFIAVITLSACKKDKNEASIYSTWELAKEEFSNKDQFKATYDFPYSGMQNFVSFNSNGNLYESKTVEGNLDRAYNREFTLSGNRINFSDETNLFYGESTYKINGNTLIITCFNDNKKSVYTFKLSDRNVKADYEETLTWR